MKFKVWEPMEMDRSEAVTIEQSGYDSLLPALRFASQHPDWFGNGAEREVWVERPDKVVHRYRVWVEPNYKAARVVEKKKPKTAVVEGHENFGDLMGSGDEV